MFSFHFIFLLHLDGCSCEDVMGYDLIQQFKFHFILYFLFYFWTFFNASLLHTYIHGAPEDMRHWHSQYFLSHKHGMNIQKKKRKKREVDESIISLPKKACKVPTWKRNLNMSRSS